MLDAVPQRKKKDCLELVCFLLLDEPGKTYLKIPSKKKLNVFLRKAARLSPSPPLAAPLRVPGAVPAALGQAPLFPLPLFFPPSPPPFFSLSPFFPLSLSLPISFRPNVALTDRALMAAMRPRGPAWERRT